MLRNVAAFKYSKKHAALFGITSTLVWLHFDYMLLTH